MVDQPCEWCPRSRHGVEGVCPGQGRPEWCQLAELWATGQHVEDDVILYLLGTGDAPAMGVRCSHCPVTSGVCPAVAYQESRYCRLVDPQSPDYHPEYVDLLRRGVPSRGQEQEQDDQDKDDREQAPDPKPTRQQVLANLRRDAMRRAAGRRTGGCRCGG